MTITRITPTTEIQPGKWVCAESGARGGICTYPRKVTDTSGQRIYFVREDGDRVQYMSRAKAAYLCDTAEEGKALCDLGIKRIAAVEKAEASAWRFVIDQFKPQLAAMLRGEPYTPADALTGAETDTLIAMIESGPLEDGDVPSKSGRDALIERGLAMRVQAIDYWRVAATHAGIEAYKAMFGPAETLSEAQANRKTRLA
jgi:hypothetical protein